MCSSEHILVKWATRHQEVYQPWTTADVAHPGWSTDLLSYVTGALPMITVACV